jgi:hypothetical protein
MNRMMAAAVAVVMAACASGAQVVTQVDAPGRAADILPNGMPVVLRLAQTLSSDSAKEGDPVFFDVVENVVVNGVVVIAAGAPAMGKVSDVKGNHPLSRGKSIDVDIDSVAMADGGRALLRGVQDASTEKPAHPGARVAVGMVFPPAAIVMHRRQRMEVATIPAGTIVDAYVAVDTPVDVGKIKK